MILDKFEITSMVLIGLFGLSQVQGLKCFHCAGTTECDGPDGHCFRTCPEPPTGESSQCILEVTKAGAGTSNRNCQNAVNPEGIKGECHGTEHLDKDKYCACKTDLCNGKSGQEPKECPGPGPGPGPDPTPGPPGPPGPGPGPGPDPTPGPPGPPGPGPDPGLGSTSEKGKGDGDPEGGGDSAGIKTTTCSGPIGIITTTIMAMGAAILFSWKLH